MTNKPKLSPLVAVLATLLAPGAYLQAQTAETASTPPPPPAAGQVDEQTIVLSPFEVTDTTDSNSYVADSTLAGNRLRTQLRDIGTSVSVITSQLLRDTNATDNTSLLQRVGGAEVGGINGNYASPGSDSSSSVLTEDTVKPTEGTRIRGLAAADNARDFFISDIPWDSYNIDRIDISRGPNAILFGEGSPAGIINAGTKGANFVNSGEVDERFGEYDSNRTTLDLNQVIVPGQVAARLDLLHDDEKYEQKPAFSKDQRISGAIRIEPAFLNKNGNRTIIKADFESGQVNSDNPRSLPPTDHITPFFNSADTQAYQAKLNGWESWSTDGVISTAANGYDGAGRAVGAVNPDPWFTNGTFGNGSFPLQAFQTGTTNGSAGTYRFTATPQSGLASSLGIVPNYGAFPGTWLTINGPSKEAVFANLPYANGGLFSDTSLTDPSIFNFYKNLIDGNMKSEWQHFWTGTANLTQTFLNDQVGVSLDYNKQHYEDGQINPFGGAVPLYVDVMGTNNDGSSLATASKNPNYGTPFVINNDYPTNFKYTSDREDERATAFATHDFMKDGNEWWQKLLGQQSLTGLADQEKQTTNLMNWQQYGYLGSNTALAATLEGGGPAGGNFENVAPQQVIYLGPSLAGKSDIGANIPRVTGNPTIGSQPINYFDYTPNPANAALGPTNPLYYNGWTGENSTLTVTNSESNPSVNRQLLSTADNITRSVTTSEALVYEGKWLNDALVGIYGWRRDINKSWADGATLGDANDPQSINYQNIGFSSAPQGRVEVQSRSYSLVAHLGELPGIEKFASKLPVDVSLSYSVSSNFQPDSSRVDVNGDPIAPPGGKTIERGILLETRDGRLSLKVNRYVTNITNGSSSGGQAFAYSLANFVGNTMYFGNVFYYHNNQNAGLGQNDPTQVGPSPGIGPDGGTVGAAGYNGSSGASYYFDAAGYHTQAMEDLQNSSTAATRAWETQINTDFPGFFKNWGFGSLAAVQSGSDLRNQLTGAPGETNFAIAQDSVSKGWEIELDAKPLKNWQVTFNATRTDATITQVGDPALAKFMAETTAMVKGAGGHTQWFWGQSISPSVPDTADAYYNNYNGAAPLGTSYAELEQEQGVAVADLAKWRFNVTTNYDIDRGFLKGVNVGGGVRYTGSEIIGYPPTGDPTLPPPYLADLSKPEMSPSETYYDLWVGYTHNLGHHIKWNIQLNIENVGRGDYLIPVTYQAPINGVASPAFYRIGPAQNWSINNRFSF